MAHGGTLFLDELGNLAPALQQKLLRTLQERAVVPVGGSDPVAFSARLLCATNALLDEDMRAGRFRVDLYHRVAEFTLRLPPLRERPDDMLHFARRFLADANAEMGREVRGITAAAEQVLLQHAWPGNVRELRNVIRRAVLLCTDSELGAEHLELRREPSPPTPAPAPAPDDDHALPLAERIRRASDALEAEILRQTLHQATGNKAAAARLLQIDYTTLHRKLKRHGIDG
jgi:DNA-binding NtrC family response regulator